MSVLLVIDDEPLTIDCFRLLFPKGQVQVVAAKTSEAGLKAFQDQRPDAVALDVRLPDASGLETFQQIRKINPKAPVILMTGYGTANTAIEATRLGAFDYVLKPLDPASL